MTDGNMDDGRNDGRIVSRRRALQLAMGGSTFALAGCLGNGGGSTDTDGGGDTDTESGGSGESGDTTIKDTTNEADTTGASESTGEGAETTSDGSATSEDGATTGDENTTGGGNVTGSPGSVDVLDRTFITRMPDVPTDVQFNPLSTAATDYYTKAAVHAWTAQVTTTSDPPTYVPMVAKNWSLDGTTFTIELNDSFTWHHGKSLTAEDLAMHYRLDRFMGAGKYYGVWNLMDSMEVTGEYTLEMQLSEETSRGVVIPEVFGEPLAYDPEVYNEYLTRFEEASDSELGGIRSEVTDLTIEEPVGAGPLQFVSVDNQKMVFEPYEEFPWAEVQQQFSDALDADITSWPDRPNFSQVNFRYVSSDRLQQEVRAGNLSGGRAGRSAIDFTQLPSNYDEVAIPGLYGWSLIFNFWDSGLDVWRDPNVRRAVAHVLDRSALSTQLMDAEATPDEYITGMTQSQEAAWLEDSFTNSLDTYDRDTDAATQYLEAADFTREGGEWYKPNGDRFSVTLKTSAGVTSYISALQVAGSNLSEFGIQSSVETEQDTSYFSKPPDERGYQIGVGPNYGGTAPHPYNAFEFVFRKVQATAEESDEPDYYLPGEETLEVPPVGQPDSDETMTVDPYAKLTELGSTTDEETARQLTKELTWATNQAVPMITIVEAQIQGVLNRDGWEFPETDHPAVNMKSAAFMSLMFQLGVIRAGSN